MPVCVYCCYSRHLPVKVLIDWGTPLHSGLSRPSTTWDHLWWQRVWLGSRMVAVTRFRGASSGNERSVDYYFTRLCGGLSALSVTLRCTDTADSSNATPTLRRFISSRRPSVFQVGDSPYLGMTNIMSIQRMLLSSAGVQKVITPPMISCI